MDQIKKASNQESTVRDQLEALYPQQMQVPKTIQDIPRNEFMVYILTFNGKAIVLGHGKYNRSKVIFDDRKQITSGHIKAIFVRCYQLFGKGVFERFIIPCADKGAAKAIEAELHGIIGGNTRDLPVGIRDALFCGIPAGSPAKMVLRMALVSSFDGINDLRLWRRKGILPDEIWSVVGGKLDLPNAV